MTAARALDNGMFAVNYMTGIAGLGFAYVHGGLTLQAEATLFELFRVRGSDTTAISPDATRTNSTAGFHAGYFIIPQLSVGGEARYQRWLTTPTRIVMGAKSNIPDVNMDTVTVAIGPRAHFKVGSMWLRPGIAYARALDKPFKDSHYNVLQIDLPVVF